MKKEEYKRIFDLEENHWWYLGMRQIAETLIHPFLKNKKKLKILDAGCGTGGMTVCLQKYGSVWGIDISPQALNFCQKRGLNKVKLASVEKIPFKNETFNLITSFDVLYHRWVKNEMIALKEFYRVLKPNGFLLIRVPAYNWLKGKHDDIVYTKHRYTKRELTTKIKIAGFKVIRITYANTLLFPLAAIKRLLEKFLPKTKEESSDIKPVHKIINSILYKVFSLEAKIISKFNLPFGLSVFVLAKK